MATDEEEMASFIVSGPDTTADVETKVAETTDEVDTTTGKTLDKVDETTDEVDQTTDDVDQIADEVDETDKPRKRTSSERIRRARIESDNYRARSEELEREVLALRAERLTPEQNRGNLETSQAPNTQDYEYGELDPAYMQDLADHRAELVVKRQMDILRDEMQLSRRQIDEQRETTQLKTRTEQALKDGSSRYADFDKLVVQGSESGDWELSRDMLEAALEADNGPDILYYLASNPDEAETVAQMSTRQMDRWFGRMETQLKVPKPRTVSKAPTPIQQASGGKMSSQSIESMDFLAFERMANKKG